MRVRGQVADDLLGRDAHADGAPDRFPRDLAGNHVGVPCLQTGEELEDGDLERGVGVGVNAVVGLYHNEAAAIVVG